MPSSATKQVSCLAPAKLNLTLHVTGQQANGYHELESLVVFCEAADQLTLAIVDEAASSTQLDFSGPFGEMLKAEADNLVLRACEAFLAEADQQGEAGHLGFHLEKNLPVSSGIGGGSADAAAALLCLSEAFEGVAPDELVNIAARLGADVPMCLYSQPLIAKGIGEQIEILDDFPTLHLVLVNPGVAVSTPKVFAALSNRSNPPMSALPADLSQAPLTGWLNEQRNDLQAPAIALAPEIAETLDVLERTSPLLARMSGSGATCFGLYENAKAAQTAAEAIAAAHPDWWVKATKTNAFGRGRAQVS